MSSVKTVPVRTGWSCKGTFLSFSAAKGRISYIVGNKPDFCVENEDFVNYGGSLHRKKVMETDPYELVAARKIVVCT